MSDIHFQPDELKSLDAALDQIIPPSPDGRMPGAGELGLAEALARVTERSPELAPVIRGGLEALDAAAQSAHGRPFAELATADAAPLMNDVAEAQPALVPSLVFHVYAAYYQHPRVVEALGHEARPPHPKGYIIEKGDLSLLDPVRARPKLYREV